MPADFANIASYYDLMYVDTESYAGETEQIRALAQKYGVPEGGRLLDIACGTGGHSLFLSRYYNVSGLDLSEAMIEIARPKVPGAAFYVMDMLDFHFDQPFDIAVNLYGSIGFAPDYAHLVKGLRQAYENLKSGALFILTPWSTRETFREGLLATSGQKGDFSFCRMETIKKAAADKVGVDMYHLVAHGMDVKHYHYEQQVTLWSEAEYRRAIAEAGFALKERLGETEFRMGAFICLKEG